jgi:hypothetical protein
MGVAIAGGILGFILLLGIGVYIYRKVRKLDEHELSFDHPPPPVSGSSLDRHMNTMSSVARNAENDPNFPGKGAMHYQNVMMGSARPYSNTQSNPPPQKYAQYPTVGRPGLPGIVEHSNSSHNIAIQQQQHQQLPQRIVETPDIRDSHLYAANQYVYGYAYTTSAGGPQQQQLQPAVTTVGLGPTYASQAYVGPYPSNNNLHHNP